MSRVDVQVTPDFIDLHTHYDPQVLWDPTLSPSSQLGVTSVVAGNCGFSLAPCAPGSRDSMLATLSSVEEMRAESLRKGVDWSFETYGEYLGTVAGRGTSINFGGYVGHTAVRMWVMGDEAYERAATADELAAMRRVVADSVREGALGFSSDRSPFHRGDKGRRVPSAVAEQAEVDDLTTRITVNFANDDAAALETLLVEPGYVLGLSDAGAHVGQICDAVMPLDFLSRWVHDRSPPPPHGCKNGFARSASSIV